MEGGLSYLFTIYGDVYPGEIVEENQFPNHTIVIQRTELGEYCSLPPDQKTLERIRELGWAIPKKAVARLLELPENEYEKFQTKKAARCWDSTYDRRVMFIIGAGASANCVFGEEREKFAVDPLRPPCGPELFQKRFSHIYNKYPGVRQSLHFLQTSEGDVETLFEQEWKEISEFGNEQIISRHINIQYYVQDVLQQVNLHVNRYYSEQNLYAVLANKLMTVYNRDINRKRKFAFVSFNQDTILEYFLKTYFRVSIDDFSDYTRINDGPFCIFKPHGSWNWGWKFPTLEGKTITTPEWLFQEKVNLYKLYYELLGDSENMIDWDSYGMQSGLNGTRLGKYNVNKSNLSLILPLNENLYYPALLLPYRDKDEFTMPSSHFWDLNYYLSSVETLVIIGWKGNERHFNRVLQSQARNIKKIIIADPHPEILENQLKFLVDDGARIIRFRDFEEFVLEGIDKEFEEK